MAITTQERTNILKLTVGLFNAAPGANYLSEFTSVFEANGHNLPALANTLGTTGAFQSLYPNFQTDSEFASKFLTTLGLQGNTEAVDFVKAKFNAGVPKAQIIFDALVALDASTSATFADARAILINKAAVAENYSVTLGASSTSLATLQGAVANVTADAASVTAANAANAGGNGQPFTLTTGTDTFVGTTGNDTFTANTAVVVNPATGGQSNTDTLQAVDTIDGGAGVDTLKIFSASGTVNLPTLSNVEVIEAQSLAGLTINTSTVAGLTNLNVTKVAAAGVVAATAAATTDVSVAMKAAGAAVGVNGGKNVTVKLTDVAAATDVVTIGNTTAAKGDVVVEMTGQKATATATLSAVNVTGGKTVSVTQKATSDASAAAADTTGFTITQGAINVTGNADTTTVTVKQDAAVTAKPAANTTGGVTETASVKFGVLKSGDVLEVAGLTLTAKADMTAAEVASAFANLVNNAAFAAPATIAAGDTQSGAAAGKGTYTLVGTAWTSGAATGDTVVFTSTTARTDVGNLVSALTNTSGTSVAPGVTTTAGKAHDATATGGVLGVVAGTVTVADAAGTIKTVTVDGYNTGSLSGGAVLGTLNLSNGGAFTSANAAAALNLTLEKVNGVYTQTAGAATLNVKSVGANTAGLAAANTTALNVSGSGLLNASTGSILTNLASIKVTETAGLNLGATALTNVTSVDTTGTTGAVTVAIDSTKATYAGGAGVDTVTFSNTTAASKAIDLGAGNDTLVFAAATAAVPTVVLKGGAGDDTVSLDAANAVTFSGSTAFAAQLDSFERLALTGATGAQNVDLGKLGFTNHVTVAGVAAAGVLTLTDLANNGTVVLTADAAAITAAIKDAATGTADVLNVQLVKGTALAGGTLTAANVETVNITATDTVVPPTAGAAIDTHTLTLAADKATAINVTGNAGLTLTTTASTKVTSIDGSTMTGNLTATSTNTTAATTIKGGSGNDVLTAATGTTADVLLGGAGNDVLVGNKGLSTLTGGAGNDVFVLNVASLDVNSYTTITDFAAGDLLQIAGATTFAAAKVTLGDTAVFQDYANAAMNVLVQAVAGTDVAVGWFQFGGNTYVVADAGAESTTFVNGQDFVVKLTGLVDLSNASFNDTYNTIAL